MKPFVNFLLSWGASVNIGLCVVCCVTIAACVIASFIMIMSEEPIDDLEDLNKIITKTPAFKYMAIICAVAVVIAVFFPGGDAWDALKNAPTNASDCIQMCKENFTK